MFTMAKLRYAYIFKFARAIFAKQTQLSKIPDSDVQYVRSNVTEHNNFIYEKQF